MFRLKILIRKIKYRKKDKMPRMFLLSMYHIISSLKGTYSYFELQPEKGIGMPIARVNRHEEALVKFLRANYGLGEYSIVICGGGRKGFKLFWRGIIEKDRFIRIRGSMSPYMLTKSPVKAWHSVNWSNKINE